MKDGQYVVVYNRNSPIFLRHIVAISEPYNSEDFKKWYYGNFAKLEGDEFALCPSTAYMIAFTEKFAVEGEGAD